jgi:hypothetical protein
MFLNPLTDWKMVGDSRARRKAVVIGPRAAMAFQHSNIREEGKEIQITAAPASLMITVKANRDWVVGWDNVASQQATNEGK